MKQFGLIKEADGKEVGGELWMAIRFDHNAPHGEAVRVMLKRTGQAIGQTTPAVGREILDAVRVAEDRQREAMGTPGPAPTEAATQPAPGRNATGVNAGDLASAIAGEVGKQLEVLGPKLEGDLGRLVKENVGELLATHLYDGTEEAGPSELLIEAIDAVFDFKPNLLTKACVAAFDANPELLERLAERMQVVGDKSEGDPAEAPKDDAPKGGKGGTPKGGAKK